MTRVLPYLQKIFRTKNIFFNFYRSFGKRITFSRISLLIIPLIYNDNIVLGQDDAIYRSDASSLARTAHTHVCGYAGMNDPLSKKVG